MHIQKLSKSNSESAERASQLSGPGKATEMDPWAGFSTLGAGYPSWHLALRRYDFSEAAIYTKGPDGVDSAGPVSGCDPGWRLSLILQCFCLCPPDVFFLLCLGCVGEGGVDAD